MPPTNTPTELHWQTLTAALEELRVPNSFVKNLVFSRTNTNATEMIGIDAWIGGRRMAPFVLPGAEGIFVPGMSKRRRIIEMPNIRIKRPFDAQQILFSRTPGSPVQLPPGASQVSEVNKAIARDIRYAGEQIDDTEEWMSCQALTGVITYTVAADDQAGDVFTINYGRPAAHDRTLTGNDLWDAATPTESPRQTLLTFQRLLNAAGMGAITDVILGQTAADAFETHATVLADLDRLRSNPGAMDLMTKYQASGARYLGTLYGTNWWEYSRSVVDAFGNTVKLITDTTAHFIANTPLADNVLEYGGIVDMTAFQGGAMASRRFSKAWLQEDPSAWIHLSTSRPLPVTRRPEAFASAIVTS